MTTLEQLIGDLSSSEDFHCCACVCSVGTDSGGGWYLWGYVLRRFNAYTDRHPHGVGCTAHDVLELLETEWR